MTESNAERQTFSKQASEIVAAYVAHNSVPAIELAELIRSVHDTLASLGQSTAVEAPAEPPKPAVPIKRSVTDDYIVSLEDGRKFKSMKRYLAGLGMTPAEYRAKWGLPFDYPLVAPAYAKVRSEQAKARGFGHRAVEAIEAAPEPVEELVPAPQPEPEATPAPKRGRAKKKTTRITSVVPSPRKPAS